LPKAKTTRAPTRRKAQTTDRETEQRILDAARRVFTRRGTAGARMQEIAAEAGVNQALLHYYFRTKERLSIAVFQQMASTLFPALMQTLGSDMTIEQKVDGIVALYLENLSKNPFLPGYIISELHHHPDRVPHMLATAAGVDPAKMLAQVFSKLGQQIDAEARAGRMRPIAPQQFAANLISLCVFPFAARPMLSLAFGFDDAGFAAFIEERRRDLPRYIRNAIRS
jgi:TetR/AcrR family transcriptional regulator